MLFMVFSNLLGALGCPRTQDTLQEHCEVSAGGPTPPNRAPAPLAHPTEGLPGGAVQKRNIKYKNIEAGWRSPRETPPESVQQMVTSTYDFASWKILTITDQQFKIFTK